MKYFRILGLLLISWNYSSAQNWQSVETGLEDIVYDLVVFENQLVSAGKADANDINVHFWNGGTWNSSNEISGIGVPTTLEIFEDVLYTSGDYAGNLGDPTYVLKWENNSWNQLDGALGMANWNSIKKLKTYNDKLYAGGKFQSVGTTEASNIASWDGANWNNLAAGIPDLVQNMDIFLGKLLVCHERVDTVLINDSLTYFIPRKKLQLWDENEWEDLDSLFDYESVNLLRVINDEVYFTSVDTMFGQAIQTLGKWDGTTITSIGDSLLNDVEDVCLFNGELYAAGSSITNNPLIFEHRIRKLVGQNWVDVSGNFSSTINRLAIYNNQLYAAGFFNQYEGGSMNFIAFLGNEVSTEILSTTADIQVYPNPACSYTFVESSAEIQTINLLSLEGRKIKSWARTEPKQALHFNSLPAGIYILQMVDQEANLQHRKIVIH